MGSVEFMRLVRQRSVPVGKADQTKEPAEERAAAESEEDEQDMEVEPEDTLGNRNRSLEDMLNFIKAEHQQCINRNEYWDDKTLQNLILQLLERIQNSVPRVSTHGRCRAGRKNHPTKAISNAYGA